jgi:DtxR family transcriptional regulator, Mn-dependent transcriptional regulator
MTSTNTSVSTISAPLEDYLETIYLLFKEVGYARVRDIAKARGVRAATVSVSLRKLAEVALIRYERREYIGLTEDGEKLARKIHARHRLLARFFEEVLEMKPAAAGEQACAMEHSLTDEAMDRLVRFFEFIGSCPTVTEAFASCPARGSGGTAASDKKRNACAKCSLVKKEERTMSIADLKPGDTAIVTQIGATGALRQRLLDLGILPETAIDFERAAAGGDPVWIRCQGARIALRKKEAGAVGVRREA